MLFHVRYRLKEQMLPELAEAVQSGGFPYKAKHVFASLDDPLTGLTIWDTPDRASFDEVITLLEDYAEVVEVIPVVSAEEAQQRVFQKLSKN